MTPIIILRAVAASAIAELARLAMPASVIETTPEGFIVSTAPWGVCRFGAVVYIPDNAWREHLGGDPVIYADRVCDLAPTSMIRVGPLVLAWHPLSGWMHVLLSSRELPAEVADAIFDEGMGDFRADSIPGLVAVAEADLLDARRRRV